LLGVEIEQRQGLLQYKEMLLAPRAGEGMGNLVFIFVATRVPQRGQDVRITFPGDDGADDAQAGFAGDIAEHLRELQVHLE